MSTKYVLEVAIFQVKPEFQSMMPELRQGLREALKDFLDCWNTPPSNRCPCWNRISLPISPSGRIMPRRPPPPTFEKGDPRFLPYMQTIESIDFMGHFAPELS